MNFKYALLTFSALSLILGGAVGAHAQDGPPAGDPPAAGFDGPPPPHDEPRDGSKDGPKGDKKGDRKAEFEKRAAEMFAKTDTNKDGFLSKDEMLAGQRERLDEMFATADTNKDGKLSPEEMKKGREAMHAKMKAKMEQMKKEHKKHDAAEDKKPDADHHE